MTHTLMLLAVLTALQDVAEVRQIVTFELVPGKTQETVELFREKAIPVYRAHAPMLRFRGYREAESPEPLDLVVVSTFKGMAGMDAFHEAVRESGASLGELYGRIGALAARHRDEFVEIDSALSWGDADAAPMSVLVSIQLAPGREADFEKLLGDEVIPWEKKLGAVQGSDTGRFLVANGWHIFRVLGITSLGDWHRYVSERHRQVWWHRFSESVARSKQAVVVPLPELSVR